MNWDAIAALSQVAAALAVAASLVYLAKQVRDSARSSRSATRQSIVDSILTVNTILPQSESFIRAFRAHLDGRELEPHQALQLSAFCYLYLRTWENVHFQYRSGMLSDEDWRGFRQNVKALMQVKAFQDFWARESAVFSEAFRHEVAALLDEIPSRPILQDSLLFSATKPVTDAAAATPDLGTGAT